MPGKRRNTVPANESKSQKFVRMATGRVGKVLADLDLIAKLADSKSYEYTQEHVQKIVTAVSHKLQQVHRAFETGGKSRTAPKFDL